MTAPLFAALPGPVGPLRAKLDARVAELAADGQDLDPDLVLVVQSLADRIDDANGARAFRGFVMLTAEYRAARRDLFEGVTVDPGPDALDVLFEQFNAAADADPAQVGHAPGSDPAN